MLLSEIFHGEQKDKSHNDYVNLPDPKKQKGKKKARTTDSKENSIIDTIWQSSNADAV